MPGPPPVTTSASSGVGIQDHQLAGVQFHPTKASHTRHSQDSIASSTASSSGCPPSSSSATSTSSSSAHGGIHGVDQRLTIDGATGNLQDDFDDIFSGLGGKQNTSSEEFQTLNWFLDSWDSLNKKCLICWNCFFCWNTWNHGQVGLTSLTWFTGLRTKTSQQQQAECYILWPCRYAAGKKMFYELHTGNRQHTDT